MNTPSKYQTAIQVNHFRDTAWKRGERIAEVQQYLRHCQKVAALAEFYEERYSMEVAWSKSPLVRFWESQKARERAEIFKAKAQNFAHQFNIITNNMPQL